MFKVVLAESSKKEGRQALGGYFTSFYVLDGSGFGRKCYVGREASFRRIFLLHSMFKVVVVWQGVLWRTGGNLYIYFYCILGLRWQGGEGEANVRG